MSGQPTPPRIVEAFGINAGAGYITNPLPVASQISVTPGAASLNDGFPPLCFQPTGSGGVPPSGKDFNGILYLLSAWVAYLAAGQYSQFDSTLATDMGGYAEGAVLQQSGNPLASWTSTTAGNSNDPDTGGADWISSVPIYSNAALTGVNNVVLPGPSDYVIDVSTSGGAITFTGFVGQRDGQRVTFIKSDNSANALQFASLSGSSSAANQLRIVSPGVSLITQYSSLTIQYSQVLSKWVQV